MNIGFLGFIALGAVLSGSAVAGYFWLDSQRDPEPLQMLGVHLDMEPWEMVQALESRGIECPEEWVIYQGIAQFTCGSLAVKVTGDEVNGDLHATGIQFRCSAIGLCDLSEEQVIETFWEEGILTERLEPAYRFSWRHPSGDVLIYGPIFTEIRRGPDTLR